YRQRLGRDFSLRRRAITQCDYRHCAEASCDPDLWSLSAGPLLLTPALGPTLPQPVPKRLGLFSLRGSALALRSDTGRWSVREKQCNALQIKRGTALQVLAIRHF